MKTRAVDVAIIGAGSAGLTARRAALKNGAEKVVMIEGGAYGTTCARVGCMPSKLLIAAGDAVHDIKRAAKFGIHAPHLEIDGHAVFDRVRRERDRFAGFVVDAVESLPEEQKCRGYARFTGPTTLEVDDHTRIEAGSVVIATGSTPFVPPPFRNLGDRMLLNDDVFELRDVPDSVAVIGTGVIALELGQALHRLGSRVTLFGINDQVGFFGDPVMQDAARRILGEELDLRLSVHGMSAERDGDVVQMKWRDHHDRAHSDQYQYVLVAAGRRPNLERLNLEAAGVELDARGLPRFDDRTMQIGDSPLFIAGDVNGDRPLLHEAADEGHFAGENAARYPNVRAHVRRTPLGIAFTEPNIARIGDTPPVLDPKRHSHGEVSYGDQGRARVMGVNSGLVRIWAKHACGTLVGAEMIGPRVEHTAHLLAWAIQSGMTVQQAIGMPFYHPVIEEGIRSALRDLAHRLKLEARPGDLDCGPGA